MNPAPRSITTIGVTECGYQLVTLRNGSCSVHALAYGETFHPGVGPTAEASAIYLHQLQLGQRMVEHSSEDEFVLWDIGLGAAANPLTILEGTRSIPSRLRLISFDRTLEPLRFALHETAALPYLRGYETRLSQLADTGSVQFEHGSQSIQWNVCLGDFPTLLVSSEAPRWPKPHAILFDPHSPARNPEMWTQPLFARLHALLDPNRPCALATFSRSTHCRVALLLAGFYVGTGQPTGLKEETTVAANDSRLVTSPLDRAWLQRAARSGSAEPLWDATYRQAALTQATWEQLQQHPQFRS